MYSLQQKPDTTLETRLEELINPERCPLVYCAEGVDNAGKTLELVLPDAVVLRPGKLPGWLNGPTVLKSEAGSAQDILIPYYAWNYPQRTLARSLRKLGS